MPPENGNEIILYQLVATKDEAMIQTTVIISQFPIASYSHKNNPGLYNVEPLTDKPTNQGFRITYKSGEKGYSTNWYLDPADAWHYGIIELNSKIYHAEIHVKQLNQALNLAKELISVDIAKVLKVQSFE